MTINVSREAIRSVRIMAIFALAITIAAQGVRIIAPAQAATPRKALPSITQSGSPNSPNSQGQTGGTNNYNYAPCSGVTGGHADCSSHTSKHITYYNSNEGELLPASEKIPENNCDIPKNAISMELGGNIFWSTIPPATLLKIRGEPIIQVIKNGNKLIISNLKMIDDRDNAVAIIENNHYWHSPEIFFQKIGKSEFIVHDHLGNDILDLKYLNPHSISLTGTFRIPNHAPVTIDSGHIAGFRLTNSCFGESENFIVVD